MSKKSSLPQSRRHIFIFDEDWEWLERFYGRESESKMGVGVAIRQIVHSRVRALKARANEILDDRREEEEV